MNHPFVIWIEVKKAFFKICFTGAPFVFNTICNQGTDTQIQYFSRWSSWKKSSWKYYWAIISLNDWKEKKHEKNRNRNKEESGISVILTLRTSENKLVSSIQMMKNLCNTNSKINNILIKAMCKLLLSDSSWYCLLLCPFPLHAAIRRCLQARQITQDDTSKHCATTFAPKPSNMSEKDQNQPGEWL